MSEPINEDEVFRVILTGAKSSEASKAFLKAFLKAFDAISFDELGDRLAETVHTAFRKGCDHPQCSVVHRAIRDLSPSEYGKRKVLKLPEDHDRRGILPQ